MINYQEIIDNLQDDKIISLMQQLGAHTYKETDNVIIFPTICHNINSEEASMKLYYYKNNHLFFCYSNCQGMSIFKFLKEYYETRQVEYDWHSDILNVIINCSLADGTKAQNRGYKTVRDNYNYKNPKDLEILNNNLLDSFSHYYPVEWLNDGISKQSMDKYHILFSKEQNKIIIPHYNINDKLIGIRGRALNEYEVENVGKYAPVFIENKCYSHPLSMNLYGLNEAKDNINKYKILFLGEAEKFCLQLDGFDIPNCAAAVCGSNFNKFQLKILLEHCMPNEIVICFDKEEKENENVYYNKLRNICTKYKNYCNMSLYMIEIIY